MTTPFPLTPGQALAVAAMIDTHPNPLPHWAGWAKALRTWAAAEFEASQPVEEPEASPYLAEHNRTSGVDPCEKCGGEPAAATGVCSECGHDTMGYYDDDDCPCAACANDAVALLDEGRRTFDDEEEFVECTCDMLAHPCEVHDCRGGAPDEVRGPDWTPESGPVSVSHWVRIDEPPEVGVVDLVAALRASVEAAKARRAAGETR